MHMGKNFAGTRLKLVGGHDVICTANDHLAHFNPVLCYAASSEYIFRWAKDTHLLSGQGLLGQYLA